MDFFFDDSEDHHLFCKSYATSGKRRMAVKVKHKKAAFSSAAFFDSISIALFQLNHIRIKGLSF